MLVHEASRRPGPRSDATWQSTDGNCHRGGGLIPRVGYRAAGTSEACSGIDGSWRERVLAVLVAVEGRLQVEPFRWQLERDVLAIGGLAQRHRQSLDVDHLAGAQDDGTLDHVLELPDVPRPVILLQHRQCIGRHPTDLATHLTGELLDEVRD